MHCRRRSSADEKLFKMHDLDKEFDLKLRSVLDSVEEEVPQRVWEGVSSRVGRRSAPVAWMRWACAGLAAAAAVALAVVLPGTSECGPDSFAPVQEGLVAEVTDLLTPAVQEEDAMETVQPLSQAVPSVAASRHKAIADAAPLRAGQTAADEAAPVQESSREQEASAPDMAGGKKDTKNGVWEDPFARMAYEDNHARQSRGASLNIGGILGTNDGARSGGHGAGIMGTSGNKWAEGISENGESKYGVPASLGLGVRIKFSDRWSVGTGVSFSALTRSFDGLWSSHEGTASDGISGRVKNNVLYVGIPVNVFFNIVSNDVLDFYTFAGGSAEKCISNKFHMAAGGKDLTLKGSSDGLQYSAALGLGAQFHLTDHMGLYLDPSARYWAGKDQPKSIRTEQPFMFNIELGLRFEL